MRPRTLVGSLAVALCTAAARGQAVINMPPPPPSAAAPPVAASAPTAVPAPAVPASRRVPTTYESEFVQRRSAEPVEPGALALARYAGARRAPEYADAGAGPLGGWVAGYGYYPYLGYHAGPPSGNWNWNWPSWGWGWARPWGWGWGAWGVHCF